MPRFPTSTYRFQFHAGFPLSHGAALVDYLRRLGVDTLYASPLLAAEPGSPHGYDMVDPARVNPELGGEAALRDLARRLGDAGMGLLADIVPNHMSIAGPANGWWQDVLRHGRDSPFAGFFDVDWAAGRGRVLLPVLGERFGRVLEAGELRLAADGEGFHVAYHDKRFPLRPRSWSGPLRDAAERLPHRRRAWAESLLGVAEALEAAPQGGSRAARHRHGERARLAAVEVLREAHEVPAVAGALGEAAAAWAGRPGAPRSFDRLEALLAVQPWRLVHWRLAGEVAGYRRFFEINELAALNIERPAVFRAVHGEVLRWVEAGWVTGLRVDHPDGLADPERYFRDLQRACRRARRAGGGGGGPFPVVAEKILEAGEPLRRTWPVAGTTGYEFMARLGGLFVHPEGERALQRLYRRCGGPEGDFADAVYEGKQRLLDTAFGGEREALLQRLLPILAGLRHGCDAAPSAVREALSALLVALPVYRSYVTARGAAPEDRRAVREALEEARRLAPAVAPALLETLAAVLVQEAPGALSRSESAAWADVARRFQQLSGPLMAKGLEDTALYRWHPLAALNEVGGRPGAGAVTPAAFHRFCAARQGAWPHGLSATSTHDTKRSEDVRARLCVLSEVPQAWERAVGRWRELHRRRKVRVDGAAAPDGNEEYLLYQTLFGTWPVDGLDGPDGAAYRERIRAYMAKALREAKRHTSWTDPVPAYERAVDDFVAGLLTPGPDNAFPAEMEGFVARWLRPGLYTALSQALLKVAAPGVPDLFQGTELWDFSLVDPDNRRPVDFARRRDWLEALAGWPEAGRAARAEALLRAPEDGRVKLYVLHRALQCRLRRREAFAGGEHVPLDVEGPRAEHALAFARVPRRGGPVLAVTGRWFAGLAAEADPPIGGAVWRDTRLALPESLAAARWRDALTGREAVPADPGGRVLPLAAVFAHLPVALLEAVA